MIPYIALFSWPVISIAFFKRFAPHIAVMVTVIAGYLVLPERLEIDLPLLPALNKVTIPPIAAFVWALIMVRRHSFSPDFPILDGVLPRLWSIRFLILLLVFGSFMTVMTNSDVLRYGPTVLPALRPYDAFSTILTALMFVLPVVLGRKYLASPQAHSAFLMILCGAGLIYSFFILIEVRMSPLFHHWVYGYFPHVWGQHVRSYGWRPVVFLGHGLLVGIFLFAAVMAAAGLVRTKVAGTKGRMMLLTLWLLAILVISTNLGALIIAVVLLPVVLFSSVRVHLIVAAVIAGIFLSYPVARGTGVIPVDRIVETAAQIDPARARSLQVRLKNEDAFMAKTSERILFGWGRWGRSRTYNPETGVDVTIADGAWVIQLSVSGWVGYIARFGLICAPIFMLWMNRRRYKIGPETSVLALIAAGNLIDLIPNSSLTPITALVTGALWGRVEYGKAPEANEEDVQMPGRKTLVDRSGGQKERAQIGNTRAPVGGYTRQTTRIQHTRNIQK